MDGLERDRRRHGQLPHVGRGERDGRLLLRLCREGKDGQRRRGLGRRGGDGGRRLLDGVRGRGGCLWLGARGKELVGRIGLVWIGLVGRMVDEEVDEGWLLLWTCLGRELLGWWE